ncbi:MAG: flagellar hook-length control protein FliK, partial [Bdellovibrionales bacterium]
AEKIANLQPSLDSAAQVQPLSLTPSPVLSMNSNGAESSDFATDEASVNGIEEASSEQNVFSAEAADGTAQANAKNLHIQNASGKNNNDTDSDKDENKNEIDTDKVIGRAQDQVKNISHKSFTIETPKATAADMQANVKEIITQAQFLAKKGGGEMKVSLNPDGMGEVNLKVKMNDGRLSVEMVTSNTEAKHLLERGLSDLKDSLAIHKLHLESVKIDSPKDLSQHMDQKQDGDKGFQQKFLNDFMDQNRGFRRDMMEFGSPTRPESQRREYYSAGYGNSTSKKSDSNRRLDLVA